MTKTPGKKALLALAALAFAATDARAFEAVANVVSVTPNREIVNEPYQSCSTEYQQSTTAIPPPPGQDHSVIGAIVGGVAGGLIGSTMGAGNGRIAMSAVGAGVGAIAGDRIGSQSQSTPPTYATTTTPVQQCRQVDHFDVRTTYTVVYEYEGQRFSTKLPYDPGNQLRVNVSVTPK